MEDDLLSLTIPHTNTRTNTVWCAHEMEYSIKREWHELTHETRAMNQMPYSARELENCTNCTRTKCCGRVNRITTEIRPHPMDFKCKHSPYAGRRRQRRKKMWKQNEWKVWAQILLRRKMFYSIPIRSHSSWHNSAEEKAWTSLYLILLRFSYESSSRRIQN